ncbi:MAG TPA: class I SAM-dependent methyltransferase [Ktedonobacteraceae bacterium]|nr:class I SAM-dependent methyltransferase [Ktedonobacteraceae bacterium]
MQPKPESYSTYYAETFKDPKVVDDYRHRPPYPAAVFDILVGLITDRPRAVLDVGAGSGDIARHLIEHVERIDAVDFSQSMIERGRQLPRGNHPNLHWIYGKVEDAPLSPPYALITAGSSIHWPEWDIAFPRFRSMLTPNGYLALIYRRALPMPWDDELRALREQFSARRGHRPDSVAGDLEQRGFFRRLGEQKTDPVPFKQTIDDFIDGLHSRSACSRERMGPQQAAEFDQQLRTLLFRYHPDGRLPLQIVGTVTWGKPERGYAE